VSFVFSSLSLECHFLLSLFHVIVLFVMPSLYLSGFRGLCSPPFFVLLFFSCFFGSSLVSLSSVSLFVRARD
jgi:hypothetical protein